jgi:hypothetical protein
MDNPFILVFGEMAFYILYIKAYNLEQGKILYCISRIQMVWIASEEEECWTN